MHGKRAHGVLWAAPLGCRPHSSSPGRYKSSSRVPAMGYCPLGVCPMPSASAHMGSTSKSESQKLPSSVAAPSSPMSPSHCFFLLTSWQASCMLIRQHWALAQPVTVSVLIQILDTPCSISGCLLDGQLARHRKPEGWGKKQITQPWCKKALPLKGSPA